MMKKLILSLLVLSSCGEATLQDVAEENVKKYITTNAHDPKSYEPVSFTQIKEYYPQCDTSTESGRNRYTLYKYDSSFYIQHTYRAKNRLGALGAETQTFYFNHDMKVLRPVQ
jgi:hypothetical protein